jgi:hypothetical protein
MDEFWRDFIRASPSKSKMKPVLTEYTWQSSSSMIEAVERSWAAAGLRTDVAIDMAAIKRRVAHQHAKAHLTGGK